MAAVLQQHPQQLQVYQQGADMSDNSFASAATGVQTAKVLGKGDASQSRAAWLEAVEDKENVDPASGLTVTTRRQRRRLASTQTEMPAALDALAGPASKGPRQPLKDITPSFPEAVVRSTRSPPDKPALNSVPIAGPHQLPRLPLLKASCTFMWQLLTWCFYSRCSKTFSASRLKMMESKALNWPR